MANCVIQNSTASALVCPKPRRFTLHNPLAPLFRWPHHHGDPSDSNTDISDTIFNKGIEPFSVTEMGSPHPFLSGSPPRRVANPLVRDVRFDSEKLTPVSPLSPVSSSGSARSGGGGSYVRAGFMSKPGVRVDGFDCGISSLV